jgi:hypothetical protein
VVVVSVASVMIGPLGGDYPASYGSAPTADPRLMTTGQRLSS